MTPQTFDIATFNTLVKDLRNAHRVATDEKNDTTFLNAEKERLQGEIASAARVADMDAVSSLSAELRRVLVKLKDGPQAALDTFNDAVEKLNLLMAGEEVVVELNKAA